MVNPYNKTVHEISLSPREVQGFVFWSRNYQPFIDLNILQRIEKMRCPFLIHMSITGYPQSIDAATISPEKATSQLKHLSQHHQKRALTWRYDPIVISNLTPTNWHLDNFNQIAAQLAGIVDDVVVSFVQVYQKTRRNFDQMENLHWCDPEAATKQALLIKLKEIAQSHKLNFSICGQPELLAGNLRPSICIDAARLSEFCTGHIHVKNRPHRKECGCVASKDIGEYDTCPHGCIYCYAVQDRTLAKKRFQQHDPDSPFLFNPTDIYPQTPAQQRLF